MKKRILLVAPSCFPIHDAESIVNIKMLKAMSKSGDFIIDLITKKTVDADYPSPSLEDLDIKINSFNVISVDNKISFMSVWGHILSVLFFGVVFKGSHWASKVIPLVKRLISENEYDYVLTKSGSSPLVGYYLKKHYGIKWVATWNDPYPAFTYPPIYTNYFNSRRNFMSMRMLTIMHKYVDKHIFPSNRLRDHMKQFICFQDSDSVIIPHVVNGNHTKNPAFNAEGSLKIIHSGNLRYPRDPKVFLLGLRKFLDLRPDAKIEVSILGVADDSLFKTIKINNLEHTVKFIKPVDYISSLTLLKDYDVALIIEAQCSEGIFMPTKVSDFMQNGIPIFAVSPSIGVLHDLFDNGEISYFADNNNVEDVSSVLGQIYEDFCNQKKLICKIPYNFSEKYMIEAYKNV